jgi:lysophospholipase L1-like esterase
MNSSAPPDPPGSDTAPQWDTTTPHDRARFDALPGQQMRFTASAVDPDGDDVAIVTTFLDSEGNVQPPPPYVDCRLTTAPGRASLSCSVGPSTAPGIAQMRIDAVDSNDRRAGARTYLTSVTPYTYVALGDSYSAGEGVDPFFQDGYDLATGEQPGTLDSRCHRSTEAYAEQVWAPGTTTPVYVTASGGGRPGGGKQLNKYGSNANVRQAGDAKWAFLACSGAVTWNVLRTPLGYTPSPDADYRERYTQLDNPAVDFGADLVTITIGGNDIGFADALKKCAIGPLPQDCTTAQIDGQIFEVGMRQRIENLREQLHTTYTAIKEATFDAPLIVVGYPQIFPESESEQRCPNLASANFTVDEQNMLRRLAEDLNEVIRSEAESVGATFVDVARAFRHHEVCAKKSKTGGPWINGAAFTAKKDRVFVSDQSFHPNKDGQKALASLVNALPRW